MSLPFMVPFAFLGGNVFPSTPFAIFNRSNSSPVSTSKYSYATAVVAGGTNLSTERYSCGGAGNLTFGIFAGHYQANLSTSDKYTYASNVVSSGGALGVSSMAYVSAVGNSTQGIWSSYYNVDLDQSTVVTRKYTYSSSTWAAAGSQSAVIMRSAAIGTANYGYFCGGYNSSYAPTAATQRYNFSADTATATTSLSVAKIEPHGTSNTTFGIVGGGRTWNPTNDSFTTDIFTFATDSIAAGTNLTIGGPGMASAGDVTRGIFAGGYGAASTFTSTSRYTYSGHSVAASTNLSPYGTSDGCGISSAPGGW